MGFLSLMAIALAGLPVIEEISRALSPPRRDAGPLFEPFAVVRLPPLPTSGHSAWHRLRAPVEKIWLNGTPLAPNPDGDFELSFLNPRGQNTVVLPGWPSAATIVLLSTPRVYVAAERIRLAPDGSVEATIAVRNSLENTVNAYLTLAPAAAAGSSSSSNSRGELEADATIPPGVTQTVRLSGKLPAQSGPPWRIVLEKQEEAMEGGYRFVRITNPGSGPTVNSYGKP